MHFRANQSLESFFVVLLIKFGQVVNYVYTNDEAAEGSDFFMHVFFIDAIFQLFWSLAIFYASSLSDYLDIFSVIAAAA